MATTVCRHAPEGARSHLPLLEPAAVLLLGHVAPDGLVAQADGSHAVAPGPERLVLPDDPARPGWRSRSTMAPLPSTHPITSETAGLGGILTQACTWSAHTLPSTAPHPLPSNSAPTDAPTSGRFCRWRTFLPCLGIQTMWQAQSHPVCDKLASFIGFLPFLPRSGHRGKAIMGRKPLFSLPKPNRAEPPTHHRHSLWISFRY